jgi:hypothetical protein
MSSAVVSTSAARGRPFIFDGEEAAEVCPQASGTAAVGEPRPPQRDLLAGAFYPDFSEDKKLGGVIPASRLAVRPAPEMVSSGVAAIDALTGGLPRGCLTEICGPASSGRTTLLLAALAAATRRGECCAVVDADDALDAQSVVAAGVVLERLLWVRCGENSPRKNGQRAEQPLEQLLSATDLLLESGGFGMIVLDLADLPPLMARRIPLTTWFRFRRAVEHSSTVLLAVERQFIAGSCSSLLIQLKSQEHRIERAGNSHFPAPGHAQLLTEIEIKAEVARSRLERKPVGSAEITFASKTAWAG